MKGKNEDQKGAYT